MKFSRSEVVPLAWSAQSVSDRQQLLVSNGLYVALLQNIPEQPDQLEWNMMGFQVRFLGCGYSALGGTWLPEPCSHGQLRSQDCGMGVGVRGGGGALTFSGYSAKTLSCQSPALWTFFNHFHILILTTPLNYSTVYHKSRDRSESELGGGVSYPYRGYANAHDLAAFWESNFSSGNNFRQGLAF